MSEYIDLPTGPLHWKDYGGSGPLIVLVHGLGGSIANWDKLGPRLARYGRVTAPDLPGFGLSPPGADWTLETHARALDEFIQHLGAPAILIGNSMGALLSEMVAANHPALVRALVLISPATPPRFPDPYIHWPTARRLMLNSTPGVGTALNRRMMSRMSSRELINESLARITHKPGRVPLEMVESFVEIAEIRSSYPWAADAVPKTGQSIRRHFIHRRDFVAMIRDIKAPTLVIHGVEDPIMSRTAVEWLCSLRLDWTLIQMDDTGHTPHIDAPVRFVGIVEPWLEDHLKQEMTV
ncbi:MAG TPA: alpha/beta hydrolase [Acidimicrobiia bacterium]|nr:alpha/beta hydrolase [Acidimicrobiia bacterium]